MDAKIILKRAKENQELLKNNPKEYIERLRTTADKFFGQFRAQLLETADKIARENGLE